MSENTKTRQDLEKDAIDAAAEWVAALNAGSKPSVIKAKKAAANSAQNAYNRRVCEDTYKTWAEDGDPVKVAIRTKFITDGKKWTAKYTKDEEAYVYCSKTDLPIDFGSLEDAVGVGHFSSEEWFDACSALSMAIGNNISHNHGTSDLDYQLDEAAENYEFATPIDFSDETTLVAALQEVFDAIKFIESDIPGKNKIVATPEGWHFLYDSMSRHSGFATTGVGGCSLGSRYIHEIMYTAMTNGEFATKLDPEPNA